MKPRVSLALALHNHQPVGNFGWVIADAHERAYEPMLAAIERHRSIRVALHYSGPLLEWLQAERPAFVERLAGLVAVGRVELLGGGLYEPVLVALPEHDRQAQLRRMADEIERLGGRRPSGAWLAERVWEPSLPATLGDAGYRYTIVDDAHFRAASVPESDLWGSYLTEDQGRSVTVLGSVKELRYRVPFGEVGEVIDLLRARMTALQPRVGFMGDDGEKFGAWPATFDHCWGTAGWVERFFTAIEANADWLSMVTPGEWVEREAPIGRIYLPTSSYAEMGEWALPAAEAGTFATLVHEAEAAHDPSFPYLRGGFWRNFQVRYREVNDLHKQMLRASAKVAAMPPGLARDRAADHLHRGQSNDCYWHGIFGGIYLSHLRLATFAHVIAAEDVADQASRSRGDPVDGIRLADTDLDGLDDVIVTSPGQVVVIDLADGGAIGSWDIRAVRHALAGVLRRRPEAYHAPLLTPGPGAVPGGGPPGVTEATTASIHAGPRAREAGLATHLVYDSHELRGGLVHLLDPATTRDELASGTAVELGGPVDQPFTLTRIDADSVLLGRDLTVVDPAGLLEPATAALEKRFVFVGDRRAPGISLEVTLVNTSMRSLGLRIGIEWPITMLGGGGNPDAWYAIAGERTAHDASGERIGIDRLASGNDWVGVEVATTFDPPATAWWWPIETISNSEGGIERTYQGSDLIALWQVHLEPGESTTVRTLHRVTTRIDRADDPGG